MKLFKNRRGLSPIFATLILIAIAVIAGIIVYMFTSGMLAGLTGGGTAGQEKIAIQSVAGDSTTGDITVYAQSTGGGPVALDSAIIKDSQGTVLKVVALTPATDIVAATLTDITIAAGTGIMDAGQSYTVTLVTVAGGNFPSTSFKATAVVAPP